MNSVLTRVYLMLYLVGLLDVYKVNTFLGVSFSLDSLEHNVEQTMGCLERR